MDEENKEQESQEEQKENASESPSNSKNVIIAVLAVVIVLLFGLFLLYRSGPSTSSKTSSAQTEEVDGKLSENSITYTSSGFSPSTLTVKVGSTVAFLNNSSEKMWVASNPHPIHTNFSEFDAKRDYAPGESYSFTFSEPGSFGFHNHLSPSQEGTIMVE